MRRADISRVTKETKIRLKLKLDGTGKTKVATGIGFLDHMLTLLAAHGAFDLEVKAAGDMHIDLHHTNEDVGIALGQAFDASLGDRKGIYRYGWAYVPMEEALARVVLDFSGRPKLIVRDARPEKVQKRPSGSHGAYQWGDAEHFLESFVRQAKITLHIDILAGEDFHHTCEAVFKALGRALEEAARLHERRRGVPSTKGQL